MKSKFATDEKRALIRLIDADKAAGLSERRACEGYGLAQSTVLGWRKKFKKAL